MATYNSIPTLNWSATKTARAAPVQAIAPGVVVGGRHMNFLPSGAGGARPTTGQLWPRGSKWGS